MAQDETSRPRRDRDRVSQERIEPQAPGASRDQTEGTATGARPGGVSGDRTETPGGAVVGEVGGLHADPQSADPGRQSDIAPEADRDALTDEESSGGRDES